MHAVVFPASVIIVALAVLACVVLPPEQVQETFADLRDWIGSQFGWLYVVTMSAFVVFAIWLAIGPYSSVRLGADDERPEFGTLTWLAMLFSAGMGIGLLFFSVAEPIYHFQTTPPGFSDQMDRSQLAMAVTTFHWGLHPWALYAIVALALAYAGFRRGLPLSFRSLMFPLLGDRVWGRTGDAIDTLAVIATLTGVATSLGIGAQQVNAGLAFLFAAPINTTIQVALIAGITAIATISVVLGLRTGIRRLSQWNMLMAAALLLVVAVAGGVAANLSAGVENLVAYLKILPANSLRTGMFDSELSEWISDWTVFYWAWWISWSPFVGMFIARVSRGRTIRQFVIGVLLVPTLVGVVWLTVFGGATLRQHADHEALFVSGVGYDRSDLLPVYTVADTDSSGALVYLADGSIRSESKPLTTVAYLSEHVLTDDSRSELDSLPTVLFVLLEALFTQPWLIKSSAALATCCVILFFVTSSDSASLVIDMIASGGNPDPPVGTRLFWAITEGVVASSLLVVGGLHALQAASIAAALPLTIVLLAAGFALWQSLRVHEGRQRPIPDQ